MTRPTVVTGTIHPGSESGTCFHSNRSCRLVPAHEGMKIRLGRWKCLGVVGATLPLWIPAPYRGTGHAFDRENDEAGSRIEDIGRPVHGGRYQAGVVAAGGFSP